MSDAQGWEAIDQALNQVYPSQEPRHYGTIQRYSLGGPDPLDGISVYKNSKHQNHWHFISFGLSELYTKESDLKEESGWGIELTFRLACERGAKEPPVWPMNFMQNLARYVFETGYVFAPGHHMDLNGPIALGEETAIRAALFQRDPQLGEIETPNGRLTFLQIVGITSDELEVTQDWDTERFLAVVAEENSLLVTDLARASIMTVPAIADRIRERIETDGSSCGMLYNDSSRWTVLQTDAGSRVELTLDAAMIPRFFRLLRGRTFHEREFWLTSRHGQVRFEPSTNPAWKIEGQVLVVQVTHQLARELQETLQPKRGATEWPGLNRFVLKVVPTQVKDQAGKVIQEIG